MQRRLKRDSNTGDFLWILRNFYEYMWFLVNIAKFLRTHVISCEYYEIFTNTCDFLWILRNFYEQLLLKNTSGCICRSSLLNQKQCGMVSTKKICRSGQSTLYKLLIETIPTRFYWLACRKQEVKLFFVQSKAPQQSLSVLILGFWHCR